MEKIYSLWIGGKRVYSLKQLMNSFDLSSVEVYYYGGGLVRWLRLCGANEIADRVEKIDPALDPSEQLAEIFGQPMPKKTTVPDIASYPSAPIKDEGISASSFSSKALDASAVSFSESAVLSSFSGNDVTDSFSVSQTLSASSFEVSSFGGSSFGASLIYISSAAALNASFVLETSSFSLTSFNMFATSFAASSFHEYEYEFETGGSFNSGSFTLGSFNSYAGSFTGTLGSFNAGSFSSADIAPKETESGSFTSAGDDTAQEAPQLSPKEKVLQNISACPLNRFGYGLHLI